MAARWALGDYCYLILLLLMNTRSDRVSLRFDNNETLCGPQFEAYLHMGSCAPTSDVDR